MKLKSAPHLIAACTAMICAGASLSAHAETGKLLLTGGVSSIDGAAGGGLTPWAVIGSNATEGEIGGTAFVTTARTKDYGLNIVGASVGIHDRYELSIAQQDFKTGVTGTGLGLPGLHLKQTILGAKVRVAGDAILDSDSLMPQIAVGVELKNLGSTGLDGTLRALGAKREGVDLYVSATKLFLGQSLLVNGTLRATKANQNGLLGFGSTSDNSYSLQPEFSVAYLISKNWVVGAEYRSMRDKLRLPVAGANGLRAEDWKDIFVAWAPNKNLSVTLAYVDLGTIVPLTTASRKQTGYYLSAQVAF
ncbi:DUF3034 family protein [Polaromonas eurypsychrophila]|uniref:DUF3034 domain-containing protein n=1 Tax=Polaromonas eurypsychrophila TaxID=1614635 RepID=A0A916S6H5_9BURK|nr:DUF3034 family protein [Polaromonas eurypsychrophila]GGA85285.1 hypothetical protein GCM10011496_02320 [Polaromonas eurypsychrophila]